MAKQKQIPAKQAYYEQILTSQLQPSREEELKSFQADYDAWNKRQQDIAAFQADYDNWVKAQTPVEQPKVETPKVETPKVGSNGLTQPSIAPRKTQVKAEEQPIEKKTYLTHADIIPSLTKVNVDKQKMGRDNYDQMKQLGEGGSVDLFNRPKVSTDELKKAGWNDAGEGTATVFSSTYTNSKGDKAGNFTPIVTDKNGKFVRALTERELTEYAEAVMDGRRKDDLGLQIGAQTSGANAINDAVNAAEKVHDLQEKYYVEPKRAARKITADNISDDLIKQAAQKYGMTEDEIRASLQPKEEKFEAPGKVDEETTKAVQEAIAEDDRKRVQKKYKANEAFFENMAKASTDIVNAPVAIAGRISGKDWSLYSDAKKQAFKDMQEQHPVASGAGKAAGMAFAALYTGGGVGGAQNAVNAGQVYNALRDEAILNGATKGTAALYGLKAAFPVLAANAANAMPVDLATDIVPTLANDLAEGEKTDEEILRDTLINTGINYGFDAAGDLVSIVNAARKSGRAVNADDAFKANIREGYEKLKTLNDIDADIAAKNADIMAKNTAGNTVDDIDNLIKEGVTVTEDANADKALRELYGQEGLEEASKFTLPDETFHRIDDYVTALAEPLNKVQRSGIMDTVTDPKAIKEWDSVNKAYEDFVTKAMESENIDDVVAAQKTLDNARKRYARAMKDIDPSISAEFNSGSYGRNITRPAYERKLAIDNEQNAQETFDLIKELEDSNKPQSIDNVPRSVEGANPLQTFAENPVDGEWKTSKLRTNTLENTGKITNPDDLPEREFAYRVFKEVEQKAAALDRYKDSVDVASDLLKQDSFDEVDVKAAMDEWQRLMDMGDEASIRKARRLALKIYGETREGGRIVQALAEHSRSTPEGQLRTAQEAIDNLVDKKAGKGTSETLDRVAEKIYKAFDNSNGDKEAFKKELDNILSGDIRKHATSKTSKSMASKSISGKNKVMKMIDKGASVDEIIDQVYKDNGGVKLTPEEQKKIYDYLTEAAKLPEGSYEQEELFSRAAKIAVGRAPSTIGQKIRSVLYNNMLGNFKTALSRNAFGNFGYQILEQARQPITAVVDRATSLATKKRSALGWNAQKAGAYASGLKKGAKEQLTDIAKHISTGRSGAKGWELALANNATTYNDSKLIGKFANNVDYYVKSAMQLGDRPFFEANYKQNFVELSQLIDKYGKENVAGLEGIKDADLPEVMDMIASVRAADSVFQKHGKMSKGLTDLRNGLGEMSEGVIGADVLSTAASPFTMTPGNMLERAIEYTPLGFAKNAIETIKEVGGKKGFNQRRFVDEASRSIAGLPLLYGTYKMAENGLTNGGYSTDPDEKAAQQEDGFIEYGFNVPESSPIYGGKTLDTSDIPVFGPFMQAGSVIAEEGITPESSLQAGEAVLGSSTLQGLKRAFGADSISYSSQDSVLDNLKNTVLSSGSQLIPSLARQTAQTLDPYKRDLGEYGTPEYYLNLMKNSDPMGRQTLPIKTDVEGNPVLQNQGRPLPEKILENYVLPMNVSEYKPSELNQEASRLLKATGENTGFTPKAKRSDLKAWDEAEKKVYTERQYRRYKEDLGKLNASMGNALTKSDEYAKLTDVEKAKALGDAYTAMKQIARFNATDNMNDNNLAEIYKEAGFGEKGVEAVIKEIDVKAALKRNEVTDSDSAREIYSNYGDAGLKTYAEIKKKLNKSQKGEDIAAAVDSIPGLNRDKKAEYYSYVDTDAKPNNNPFGYVPGINYDPEKDKTFSTAKKLIPTLTPEKYYKTKDSIDTDGNGNIKESEILEYINANARNEEEANKMWTAYHGESKNKKGKIKKVKKVGNKYIASY